MNGEKEKKPEELTDEQMNKVSGGEADYGKDQCYDCGKWFPIKDMSVKRLPEGIVVHVCRGCKGKKKPL